MSLKIRMSRGGSKKRPFYRIVVADSRMPRDGRFIEKIGHHNPMMAKESADRVVIDLERAKHWISQGAKPSDRVARFLDNAGVLTREIPQHQTKKAAPKAKAQERLKEKADKVEAAAAAEAEAAEAAKAAAAAEAEAPAEEAPVEEPVADEAPAEEAVAEEAPAEEATAEEEKS